MLELTASSSAGSACTLRSPRNTSDTATGGCVHALECAYAWSHVGILQTQPQVDVCMHSKCAYACSHAHVRTLARTFIHALLRTYTLTLIHSCAHVCTHTYALAYVHTYIHSLTHTQIAHTHNLTLYTHTQLYTLPYTYTQVHTLTYTHTHTNTHTGTHTHARMHTHTHTHTQAHTHTHTQSQLKYTCVKSLSF